MPPKIAKNKQDPRVPIALNMMADLFLRSITRFSPLSKLPKLTAVDERLKERALQAIQAKSPEDRKISVTKVSQLGPGNLWKGLDLAPQRISRSPGNQQRLQTFVNQTPLNPQHRRYQPVQNNTKVQTKPETQMKQNSPKKPIQRNHNRAVQNNLNDSRNIGPMKQVTGNIVSHNLVRNQKSVRDDFAINDKSTDKRRKFSNQNDKSLNEKSIRKNGDRNMTQSRAFYDSKEKRVSFSLEKPQQHLLEKKQATQVKKIIDPKPPVIAHSKAINIKEQKNQSYVYVPPSKKVVINQQQKTEHNQSNIVQIVSAKIQNNQSNIQAIISGYQSVSSAPIKEPPKNPVQNSVTQVVTNTPQIKIKSRQQILAQQGKSQTSKLISPPATSSASNIYQSAIKKLPKQEEMKAQIKKIVPNIQQQSISKPQNSLAQRTQTSPKKVVFNLTQNSQHKGQTSLDSQKPALKNCIVNQKNVINQNIEVKKNVTILKSSPILNVEKTNVSLNLSIRPKSPSKQQASYRLTQRKKTDVSVEEMKKDWSKIKENLKYDRSFSPSNTNNKKIPERQDIALKMLAQLFLDASTRYFPGLSMLLKRGISKEEIDKIRSKSSEFKINVSIVDRKPLAKPQPKTERKLNWKQNLEADKVKQRQNNRMSQAELTTAQQKIKKPEEMVIQIKKNDQSSTINNLQVQERQRSPNIVSQSLNKNNKRITRDDLIVDKQKIENSQRSNSIRESPDVYRRETSRRELEDSKKNLEKMKNEANKSQYVYQPPTKSPETKKDITLPNKVQDKPIQKIVTSPKPQPILVVPLKKQEPKPYHSRTAIKNEVKQPQKPNKNEISKTTINITQSKPEIKSPVKSPTYKTVPNNKKQQQSTYFYQPPVKWQPRNNSPQNNSAIAKPVIQPIINQYQSISTNKKPELKPNQAKQSISKQIVQSKSQTNIIQPQKTTQTQPIKPVVPEIIKLVRQEIKNVNYGQKNTNNSEIKPKPQPENSKLTDSRKVPVMNTNSLKNISVISQKSQTSVNQQIKKTPIQQPKPQQSAYQPPSKTPTNNSTNQGYFYQPPSKKDIDITKQPNISTKTNNSLTLRQVQSEKAIKIQDPKEKPHETTMIKRQQKILIGNVQTPRNNQTTVTIARSPQSNINKKQPKLPLNTNQQSQIKQARTQSKRFSSIVFFVLKRRLSSNYSFCFEKIQQKVKNQSQILQHASFLARSLANFTNKYQQILSRNAFNNIKTNIVIQLKKTIKENKPVQENQIFSSRRKQSASRIIYWFMTGKISTFFQPLRKLYLDVSNKKKVRQNVLQTMIKVFEKRQITSKKTGFETIKRYQNQRQAVLSTFASILRKISYTAISQNFTNLISKDIKQLGVTVKTSKLTSITQLGSKTQSLNEAQKTLQKSRSQQTLPFGKIRKEQSVNIESQTLSSSDEVKLQLKRKELDKKINDLQNKKHSVQQQTNSLNKEKRQRTKKNGDLKVRLKELQKELQNREANQNQIQLSPKSKKRETSVTESELIPVLTRIYAYLFEDPDNTQIVVQRFLSDNQHCFQLPTNPALMNEWKVINKNAELKRLVKIYEGEQPREKRIVQVLQEENHLMGKLLRSFVRERYIWEWVNIIAHE